MQNIPSHTFITINSVTVLLLGIIAASFFYFFQSQLSDTQRKIARYMMWYQLLLSCALIGSYTRVIGFEGFAIITHNLFYILATYFLWHGIALRSNNSTPLLKNKWMYLNIIFIITINYFVLYLWIDNMPVRGTILVVNISLLLLSHFFASHNAFITSKKPADIMLKYVLLITSIINPLVVVFLYFKGFDFYLLVILPIQILQTYISSTALIAILMLDNVDRHYLESITDGLTGLYNRRFFEKEAKSIIDNQGDKCAIIICDIDNFKNINDTYGHDVGDLVIQQTSNCIRSVFKDNGIFGRYGGEEFVMLCLNYRQGFHLANEFRQRIENMQIDCNGISISVTISIGLAGINLNDMKAVVPVNAHNKHILYEYLKQADNALYQAKNSGKNKVCIA